MKSGRERQRLVRRCKDPEDSPVPSHIKAPQHTTRQQHLAKLREKLRHRTYNHSLPETGVRVWPWGSVTLPF